MFKRAGAYLNLSPAERAFLRLVEGLIVSALIAGVQAVMPLLNSGALDPSAVPWQAVAHTFIATVLGALGAAGVKFFKAQGDPPLPPANPPALPTPPAALAVAPAAVVSVAPTVPPIVAPIAAEVPQP